MKTVKQFLESIKPVYLQDYLLLMAIVACLTGLTWAFAAIFFNLTF